MVDSRIEELQSLKPGWDDYCAQIPNEHSYQLANTALLNIEKFGLKPRRVLASIDGGIRFLFGGVKNTGAYIEMLNNEQVNIVLFNLDGDCTVIDPPKNWMENISDFVNILQQHLNGGL